MSRIDTKIIKEEALSKIWLAGDFSYTASSEPPGETSLT
jgi:hypothetical protein